MLNIKKIRSETPACQHKIHLNNAGASLQPLPVLDAVRTYFELEAVTGGYETAALKAAEIAEFYAVVAKLLHTKAQNIAFASNATEAYNKALSAIPFQSGDVIVTSDDDYISNQIAFLFLKKKVGVKIIRADKLESGGVDVDSVADLIKRHSPKLVAITHVPTNSGLVQDVYAIGKLCRAHDILYLVDACQSAGQLELDVEAMCCDFLSATFRKFLRGPRGTGFLYVSDKALAMNLEPIYVDLHGAEWIADFEYRLSPTAKRFEYWERNYANCLGAAAATKYALEIGLADIEVAVQQLADYTRTQFAERTEFDVLDKGIKRCGIVTIHSKKHDWKVLKNQLVANNFNVSAITFDGALIDFREKGVEWALRVSPHYYNTKAEIDLLIDFLG